MADVNDIYKQNSDNIKAEDIGNNMWTMTIKSADVKAFDNGAERKIVLTFMEWDKALPLNVTNARTIASIYGHDSNGWVGRQIMLFTMMVDYQGKQTLGIRVRAPMAPQQPQMQQPRQPGQLQPGQPAPAYNPALNSPQRPIHPPQQPNSMGLPPGAQPFAPINGDEEIPF